MGVGGGSGGGGSPGKGNSPSKTSVFGLGADSADPNSPGFAAIGLSPGKAAAFGAAAGGSGGPVAAQTTFGQARGGTSSVAARPDEPRGTDGPGTEAQQENRRNAREAQVQTRRLAARRTAPRRRNIRIESGTAVASRGAGISIA